MKNALIHRGMYVESLRRLRLAGILLTGIPVILTIPVILIEMVTYYAPSYYAYPENAMFDSLLECHPLIMVLTYLAPVLLVSLLFCQQNRRCDSDFYHSLPLTKAQLGASWFAAAMTWCGIILIGSSLAVWLVTLLHPVSRIPSVPDLLLPLGSALLGALMIGSVLYLAYNICGNTVSALFSATILLFAPTIISYFLSLPVAEYSTVASVESLNLTKYQLIYFNYTDPAPWIVTPLVIAACLLLGYAASSRRKSEIASQASVSRFLQTVFRLTIAYVCCLPALWAMFYDTEVSLVVIFYILALVVYFLYELFTTKKPKNMLKAAPWLGVLVALNIVSILGMNLSVDIVQSFRPEAAQVESVTITKLEDYHYDYYDYPLWDSYDYTAEELYYENIRNSACIPEENYYYYQTDFNESNCTKTALDSERVKTIVCDALERSLDMTAGDYYYDACEKLLDKHPDEKAMYRIAVKFDTGLAVKERLVWVYNSEMKELLKALDAVEPLPSTTAGFTPNLT